MVARRTPQEANLAQLYEAEAEPLHGAEAEQLHGAEAEQLHKSNGPRIVGDVVRSHTDQVARVVSVQAIGPVVRAHGAGDRVAAWISGRQLSLITTPQLNAAGIDKDAIVVRRRRGVLHLVHRGVYLFGSAILLPGAWELAAVLACGDGAVVSHRAAAVLWGLAASADTEVDVTVLGHPRRPGVRTHRVQVLDARDRRLRSGIPVTSPARTLVDFAGQALPEELEQAIAEARVRNLASDRELGRAIARVPRRRGVAAIRREREREAGPQWTHRGVQRRLLALIRQARLPLPRTEVTVEGYPADFLWVAQRLIVETDGYQAHGHRRAFERDRLRDQVHVAAGYRVIRVTWRQLEDQPLAVIATIARALGR